MKQSNGRRIDKINLQYENERQKIIFKNGVGLMLRIVDTRNNDNP